MKWVSVSALPEPGFKTWYLNGGISTRTTGYNMREQGIYFSQSIPIAEISPLAYPYLTNQEDMSKEAAQMRASLEDGTYSIGDLILGEFSAYSPYGLLHRNLKISLPSSDEKEKAIAALPYIAEASFIEQRTDSRLPVTFTFIRQPEYYAIFNSGELVRPQQTYGLGLLWHPEAGTFIQPRGHDPEAIWGTLPGVEGVDGEKAFESKSFFPEFNINGSKIKVNPGIYRYGGGDVLVDYILGNNGKKEISFLSNNISIKIHKPGPILEYIPFLSDCILKIVESSGRINVQKNGKELQFIFKGANKVELLDIENSEGTGIQSLRVEGRDAIEYQIIF